MIVLCDQQSLDVLLPQLAGVVVERVERDEASAAIWGRVKAKAGICPSCGGRSDRVHSRYDRRLADSAIAGQPMVLRLQVRRFFCDRHDCPIKTIAEQVDGLTGKHARRTVLCREALEHLGVALAGRAGTRLAGRLGWVAGRNTLLRLVQALPDHPAAGQPTSCATRERNLWQMVGTLRRELPDRLLIINERHLRAVALAYLRHYHQPRPHRTLDQRAPAHAETQSVPVDPTGHEVRRESAVGGLINEYHLAA